MQRSLLCEICFTSPSPTVLIHLVVCLAVVAKPRLVRDEDPGAPKEGRVSRNYSQTVHGVGTALEIRALYLNP